MIWYSHLFKNFPQFVVIHTVKGFSAVNEADVFLEFCSFLHDPVNVGNLISDSSAFSKSNLSIWKFLVHILLKPSLKAFEHNLASKWNEHSYMMVSHMSFTYVFHICLSHSSSLGLEWKPTFSSPVAIAEFSKFTDLLHAAL